MRAKYEVNHGGEGEIPGVLNQQPPAALRPNWRSVTGKAGGRRKNTRELHDPF